MTFVAMNTAPSIDRSAAAVATNALCAQITASGFDALMIHITPGGIGNSDPPLKCGNS